MLREAFENEIGDILKYLRRDVPNCIYMYTDIFTYGLDNPNVKVWVEDSDNYNLVVMKYHDSFQLYASDELNWDTESVCRLIREYDIQMVNGSVKMISDLRPYFEEKYTYSTGTIFRLNNCEKIESKDKPQFAEIGDACEIAELLTQDPYYSESYTKEELQKQLSERMRTGMGRSCIIKRDGKIIAHCASFTEADGIAVSAGTIAHKDYRGQKLGLIVENYMNRYMNDHGYEWYGFILEDERVDKFQELGNTIVATYAKLVKNSR